MNRRKQIAFSVVGVAVGAIALGIVFFINGNSSIPEPRAESTPQTEPIPLAEENEEAESSADVGSILVELDLSICGEYPSENGATKTTGTDANPALLIKGGEGTTIPICIRSTDSMPRTLHFQASDLDSPVELPKHGINVTFDKTVSTVTGSPRGSYSGVLPPVADVINVFVTLDNDSELGDYAFQVRAQYEIENNDLISIGKPVYVSISN